MLRVGCLRRAPAAVVIFARPFAAAAVPLVTLRHYATVRSLAETLAILSRARVPTVERIADRTIDVEAREKNEATLLQHIKANDVTEALSLLKAHTKEKLQPGVKTYAMLMTALSKRAMLKELDEVRRDMRARGVAPDVVVGNILIHAHGEAGDFERMMRAFNTLLDSGLKPTVATYNTMMTAFGRAGEFVWMMNMFDRLENDGLRPTAVTYNAIASAYARHGDAVRMESTVEEMRRAGITPNGTTRNILLDGYLKKEWVDKTETAFRALLSGGHTIGAGRWPQVATVFAERGHYVGIMRLVLEMRARKVAKDEEMFPLLARACAASRDLTQAFTEAGVDMDETLYARIADSLRETETLRQTLARAYAASGPKAILERLDSAATHEAATGAPTGGDEYIDDL